MQNFGKIKNFFNTFLVEGIGSEAAPSKNYFKNYIKTIKENKALKTQFLVYYNLENKVEPDQFKAAQFVKENIDLLNKFDRNTLLDANTKLASNLEIKNDDYEYKTLHEHITSLIFTKRTPITLDSILESQTFVINHIVNNKEKETHEAIDLPAHSVSHVFVETFNTKYDSLDEGDKKILKTLIDSTDEEKIDVYKTMVRECIELINAKLIEADIDTKDKLLMVKDKLLNDKPVTTDTFITQISKLVELKERLHN